MTHAEINNKICELERKRRDFVEKVMTEYMYEYDKSYNESRHELINQCAQLKHEWRFIMTNPAGYHVEICNYCHTTRIDCD